MNVPEIGSRIKAIFRPTIWQHRMAFVWNSNNDPALFPNNLIPWMKAYGFKAICIKSHDGTSPYLSPGLKNFSQFAWYVKQFQDAGFIVGHWAYLYGTDIPGETQLASELTRIYGFDFYIADAEQEFKFSFSDSAPLSERQEHYGRSQRWVTAWRNLRPSFPSALSSFGRCSYHDIDWGAWQKAGFRWLPQTYLNESVALSPFLCANDTLALKHWKKSYIHPMIGIYVGARGRLRGLDYLPSLSQAGTIGLSTFASDYMDESDYRALQKARAF